MSIKENYIMSTRTLSKKLGISESTMGIILGRCEFNKHLLVAETDVGKKYLITDEFKKDLKTVLEIKWRRIKALRTKINKVDSL